MLASQYLILAKEVKQNENGTISYNEVCQHFYVKKLPANGNFDLATVCGPGWNAGSYHLHIAMKVGNEEPLKIGFADINIVDEFHIFTAKINNIGIVINNTNILYLQVYKHTGEYIENDDTKNLLSGELIIERPFKVITSE
ncbi:MAG: hypothetical protein AB1782_01175 [Cyanobacteriota bacterium]